MPNHHAHLLIDGKSPRKPGDPRFGVEPVLPWALAWTGYIAIRATTLREHDLYFDEGFRGWGVDDTEWGYRVWRSGTGIVLREDLVSIHMPHARDSKGNLRSEKTNLRHFLGKWPTVEVELAAALGAFEANDAYRDFRRVVTTAVGEGNAFSAIAGETGGERHLVLGVVVDERQNVLDAGHAELVGRLSDVERTPLVGLALPYEDRVIDICHVLPSIFALGEDYAAMVVAEATRVSHTVVKPSS